MFRILVDFNTMGPDKQRRVHIPTHVDDWLIKYLRPGLRVLLFEPDDIEVEAILEYVEKYDRWLGIPDWSTKSYLARVDFDSLPPDVLNRIPIPEKQMKFLLHLIEAKESILLEDDVFEVDAEFVFDEEKRAWYAIPDWSTRRDFDILPPDLPASD